jgi:hypothetical protein
MRNGGQRAMYEPSSAIGSLSIWGLGGNSSAKSSRWNPSVS